MNNMFIFKENKLSSFLLNGLAISTLVVFASIVEVSAETFRPPTLRSRNGTRYEIDRCMSSPRYSPNCSEQATQQAADNFCEWKGYERAADFDWGVQSVAPAFYSREYFENGALRKTWGSNDTTQRFYWIKCE